LLLLFDLFWIAAGTSDRFYRDLISEIEVELFVDEAFGDSSAAAMSNHLIGVDGVLDFEYISRGRARERLIDMVGTDLLAGYDAANPLPRSYLLTVDDASLTTAALDIIETQLLAIEGVGSVHFSREWLDKAERAKSVILQVGLVLGGLILAAALTGSANNIRLMTQARAVGFRQMLLQGSGRLFIAFPFLIESFLISGISAALGWGLIWYGKSRVGLSRIEIIFPHSDEIILFCAVVAVLGAFSSYLGLRKLLKV
jgi:cell division protein FtsX